MSRHIARREVKSAIESDRKVCEITAYPIAALQDVTRRNNGTAGHVTILDIVVQPAADGLNSRHSVLDVAELLPGEICQLVGVAIPAGQRVAQQGGGKIARSLRNGGNEIVIVRLRGNGDDRIVPETIGSRREFHAKDAVLVAVVELLGREVIA